jgi:exodeoxyribonuclease V alpha subunit
MTEIAADPFDPRRAREAPALLRPFNDIGLLTTADVHVAARLTALAGEPDEDVALAAALAVRAPRLGHVYVDLATIATTATLDTDEPVDLAALPWPSLEPWLAALARSPLVAVGEDDAGADRPLRLVDTALYLDRYWREERSVAADLLALAATPPPHVDRDLLAAGIARLFADATGTRPPVRPVALRNATGLTPGVAYQPGGRQAQAAAAAVTSGFSVIAGGPGTGKTTTVAHVLALLFEQADAAGAPRPLVALAAPTGKAAARLEEAVRAEGHHDLSASTLHRLLGWRPDSHSRFRHHRGNRLPHDVVIVDETSMVSLSLMGRLVEAVRPDARLVLVGDPGQLTSIEAGAVLGDIVGPATPTGTPLGDGIVVLDRVHRFGGGIAQLAEAIRRGDDDAVIATLASAPEGVRWLPVDAGEDAESAAPAPVREAAIAAGRAVAEPATTGDAAAALAALSTFRLLCAHRRGPHGVDTWTALIERWLTDALPGFATGGHWYAGRPLLVTENDYSLRLYNGDAGVVVRTDTGDVAAAFARGDDVELVSPSRLGPVDTVYAMTIHKSQGSQFDDVAVVVPPPTSPILTRELLYTAVTRARRGLLLVGTEDAIRAAVARPAARASRLRARLWPDASGPG